MHSKKLWTNWESIKKKIYSQDYIIFGQGEWANKTLRRLPKKPVCILDNNKSYANTYQENTIIELPDKLNTMKKKPIILITSVSYNDIARQLESFGYEAGTNLFCSPILNDQQTAASIKNNEQNLIFTCSDTDISDSLYNGGGIYKYNTQTKQYFKKQSGRFQEIKYFNNCIISAENSKGIFIFDTDLNLLKQYDIPENSSVHGVTVDEKSNMLYVANTSRDSILVYDMSKDVLIDEFFISRPNTAGEKYRHHINDLSFYNNELFVSMFSFSGMWKSGIYDGGVLKIDPNDKTKCEIISNLWMPHSVTFINDTFVIIDSLRGDVYKNNNQQLVNLPGFIRGITYDHNYYYIAQSEHRHFDRLFKTKDRIMLDCGIYTFDEETKVCTFSGFSGISNIHSLIVDPAF